MNKTPHLLVVEVVHPTDAKVDDMAVRLAKMVGVKSVTPAFYDGFGNTVHLPERAK